MRVFCKKIFLSFKYIEVINSLISKMLISKPAQVEQPQSSVLVYIPYLQHIIDAMGRDHVRFRRLCLGCTALQVG